MKTTTAQSIVEGLFLIAAFVLLFSCSDSDAVELPKTLAQQTAQYTTSQLTCGQAPPETAREWREAQQVAGRADPLDNLGAPPSWTAQDTALQLGVQATLYEDYHQTEQIAHDPNRFHETNPLLGDHPDPRRVRRYFAGASVVTGALAVALPPGRLRSAFQTGVLAVEWSVVRHNRAIGLTGRF